MACLEIPAFLAISAKEKCDELNKIDSDGDMWYPLPVYERDLY